MSDFTFLYVFWHINIYTYIYVVHIYVVNHDVEILINRVWTYSVSINHFMRGGKKERLIVLNLNHDRKVCLQNV